MKTKMLLFVLLVKLLNKYKYSLQLHKTKKNNIELGFYALDVITALVKGYDGGCVVV